MKVIISCCNGKNGELFIHNGSSINFVSHVKDYVPQKNEQCFHPDYLIPYENRTWRKLIEEQGDNNNLLPAYKLYRHPIYEALYEKYGEDLLIFSAGWGIVRADYKLPKYNITFSHSKNTPIYARRRFNDSQNPFNDFNQLKGIKPNEELIFIAGSDYVTHFCKLTEGLVNKKIIIYNSDAVLKNNPYLNNNNFTFIRYQTNRRTNWHYEFANKFINGESNYEST